MKVYLVVRVEDEAIAAVFFDEQKAKDYAKEKGEWDYSVLEHDSKDEPPGSIH